MRLAALALAFLLVLMLATPGLASASTRAPFSATLVTPGGPQNCDRMWTDDQGVLHARGCQQAGTITGDMTGTLSWTVNLNLLAFGPSGPLDGTAQVKGTITLDGESAVSFTISAKAFFHGGVQTGNVLIDGVGAHEDVHIVGTLLGISNGVVGVSGTSFTK